ncbi:hypothetical protein BKA65DRAFT_480046 [Rhexocercosporidium sp. MPI-PUGE-AT-0058]|nr:hypothetical protein BKA65DRAFT_480046 [Rhexocercosporidium sp. MPI-PUGE-AT-0058]
MRIWNNLIMPCSMVCGMVQVSHHTPTQFPLYGSSNVSVQGPKLCLMCCLSSIPTELKNPSLKTTRSRCSFQISHEPNAYIAARTELLQASLIRRKPDKDELWVHRLVQDSVRTKMTPDFATKVFWCASRFLWSLWPSAMSPPSRLNQVIKQPKDHVIKDWWPICEILFPHVLRLVYLYPTIIGPDLPAPDLDFAFVLKDAG